MATLFPATEWPHKPLVPPGFGSTLDHSTSTGAIALRPLPRVLSNLCRGPNQLPVYPRIRVIPEPLGAITFGKLVTASLQTVTKVSIFPSNYAKIITP